MAAQEILKDLTLDDRVRILEGDGSWKTYNANGKLPAFVMSDGPHGLRKQEEEKYSDLNKSKIATCFPTASCIASSWNKKSLYTLGNTLGKEAAYEAVNLVLGPGINIKRSPLCGRNFEYYSEDPYLTGTLATAYITGMKATGADACIKHFACNNQEKRRQTSNSIIDERTMREIYLRGFEIAIKKGAPAAVMGSYNRINGEYACANKWLLTDVLRNDWNFKGIVVSDWGACIDAAKCIQAGMDLSMPDSNSYITNSLKKALADKIVDESQINKTAERILETAIRFEEIKKSQDCSKPDYDKHHEIARLLAEDSAVLLKNNDILPIESKKIIVVGELAQYMKFQGGGSSHITTRNVPNAIEALQKLGYQVIYEKGYYSGFGKQNKINKINKQNYENAIETVKKAASENIPVLFFAGLTEKYEGEGFDRTTLSLPKEQSTLLAAILEITKKVVVINFSGAPVDFSPAENSAAILQMYLAGEAVGEAIANIISGKTNPSGKLAETYPAKLEDTPCFNNFSTEEDNIPYKENVFVGYRHYEKNNIPVQYEFGFGLSYTSFTYENLQIEQEENCITASLNITNTGNRDGSEIVQIYVESENESVLRPKKELRGFEKIFLKAGETKTVSIELDDNSVKAFSTEQHKFITIGGNYSILAAASINDIRLKKDITVEGAAFEECIKPVEESFYEAQKIVPHKKGSFTLSDSMGDMAKESGFVRGFLKILETVLVIMNKGKSKEDPAVKIAISAIKENPLESLISTSGGAITEKMARFLIKAANK